MWEIPWFKNFFDVQDHIWGSGVVQGVLLTAYERFGGQRWMFLFDLRVLAYGFCCHMCSLKLQYLVAVHLADRRAVLKLVGMQACKKQTIILESNKHAELHMFANISFSFYYVPIYIQVRTTPCYFCGLAIKPRRQTVFSTDLVL